MRTERITLEVTHDLDARLSDWIVSVIDESLGLMESVRVVEGAVGSVDDRAYADRMGCDEERDFATRILDQRDAAIREREEARKSWLRSEESGTRLLAERNAALDAADGLRKRVAELEAQVNDLSRQRGAFIVRIADLESQLESVACRAATAETALEAASGNSQAILDGSQAASGGGEGEPVAWREHVEQMLREWWSPSINDLGDRATLEQFIGEEGIDSLIDFVCDERKGPSHPPQPRGWLTQSDRQNLEVIEVCLGFHKLPHSAAFVRSLLGRSSPPEVVLPDPPFHPYNVAFGDWMMCLDAVRSSLAAAGVAVKEVS